MDRKEILKYLIDKKEILSSFEVLPREKDIEPTKKFIVSVVGPRRAGKTYSLYDLILNRLELEEEDYIFMDFEDARLIGADYEDIIEAVNIHEEEYGEKPEYLFLDEVQNVENWNRAVRSLYETKNHYIFITGSSSKLLSKELSTSLRGRTVTYSILPFSFQEYLSQRGFDFESKTYSTSQENKIKNHLRDYLKNGGFPDIVTEEKLADRFFDDYIDLVVFRDLVERHQIKNVFVVKFLIKNLLSSFSKQFSVHKVFRDLKSQNIEISKKTLYNYVSYLEDAFFSFFLNKFSYSIKKSELSVSKAYINDTGLVNSVLTNFSENIGKLMENRVFLELLREKNTDPNVELFYWKDEKREVDFVVKKGEEIEKLIQVCYSIDNKETKKRELEALNRAGSKLKCDNLLVITWDHESRESIADKRIEFIPLWKWLLS